MTLTQATMGRMWAALLAVLLVASLAFSASAAFAQTEGASGTMQTTQAADGTGDTAPGVPNTGGVDPSAVVLTIVAAVVVAGGLGYLLTAPRSTAS